MKPSTQPIEGAQLVDIAVAEPDPHRREELISWGASYLQTADEGVAIRAAALALHYRQLFSRSRRSSGIRLNSAQLTLQALGYVTACARECAAQAKRKRNGETLQ
jgi:hypothetical protein